MKYEVEVKSLLGDKKAAESFREKLMSQGIQPVGGSKQLNHYFLYTPDDGERLLKVAKDFLSESGYKQLEENILKASDVSVRTRDADNTVFFVAKISVGSDTSANGVKRIEIQEKVGLTLGELDQKLLDAGLEYQAKWSRDREDYEANGVHITLDRNAGYGYLAEFEKEVEDENEVHGAHKEIVELMNALGAEELLQDRLERMFAHYNVNWRDYYGTDKIFTIE